MNRRGFISVLAGLGAVLGLVRSTSAQPGVLRVADLERAYGPVTPNRPLLAIRKLPVAVHDHSSTLPAGMGSHTHPGSVVVTSGPDHTGLEVHTHRVALPDLIPAGLIWVIEAEVVPPGWEEAPEWTRVFRSLAGHVVPLV